jgi:hypothetical protein
MERHSELPEDGVDQLHAAGDCLLISFSYYFTVF